MNLNSSGIRVVRLHLAVGLLLAVTSPLFAEPRSPLPPWPEANPLAQLTWDAVPVPLRDNSTRALGEESATLVESWSGYALQREGLSVAPLVLPGVNAAGKPNLGYRQGCVRFWFAPSWTSGTGPGRVARLAEWLVTDGKQVGTLWALSVNESGTLISLGSQGADVLLAEINWSAGAWHQVALNYDAQGTELFIDGVPVATGAGLLAVAPKISGLVIGSDWQGLQVAGGQFDECRMFVEPMSVMDVAFNYRCIAPTAALGPITKEELLAEDRAARTAQQNNGGTVAYRWDGSNPCPTNVPLFLTNVIVQFESNETWTVMFDVAGGTNGVLYDVFATTNLTGGTATNGAWWWVTNTYTCSTVVLSNQAPDFTLYQLGTAQDSDGDGLTDAFEVLVSATNPNNADTDGDGIPDGWEWNHGLNPHDAADAADDPDGDWLTNWQEYNGGTNSSDPHDVMVLAWGFDAGGQLAGPTNLRNITAVDGGLASSVALRADGSVVGWGSGTASLPNWTNVMQLSADSDQVAVLKTDRTVSLLKTNYGLPPSNLTNAIQVAAGDRFCLALRSDATVTAWGTNNAGQSTVPSNLPPAKAVTAGWEHSVVLLQDGTVRAWGQSYPSFGWNVTNVPAGLGNVVAIAAGGYHTLALKADGTVAAWGAGLLTNNTSYQNAQKGQSVVPPGLSNVVAISAGGYHSMALKADGTVVGWGDLGAFPYASAQGQIVGIGSGDTHGLAIRPGRLTPLITLQPKSVVTLPGSNVTFNTLAIGLTNVLYQWRLNGTNIVGAANPTLTVSNVQSSELGNYSAIISNGAGSVTTSNATLTFLQPPTILSTAPAAPGSFVVSNLNFSLSVVASNSPGFANYYQWYQGGILISNATATNYSVSWGQVGDFTVKVWNVVGTNTSAAWTISDFPNMTSLYDALWADWHARTNGRTDAVLASIDVVAGSGGTMATNGIWNTNWFFYGTKNFTAMTHAYTNAGAQYSVRKSTVISRVALLQAGHPFCGDNPDLNCASNQWFLCVDATNGQHWSRCVAGLSRWSGGNDTTILVLESPLSTNIATMPIVWPTTVSNHLTEFFPSPMWPTFTACQHSRVIGNSGFRWEGDHLSMDQDSGSPTFIVVSNRLVAFPVGQASPNIYNPTQFLSDYTNVLERAGYSPSDYPVEIETLEQFPKK